MADTKISAATNTTTPISTDMIPFARSADTTARKITVANLFAATDGSLAALDTRLDTLEAGAVTFVELDASPSIARPILQLPNGSLTDVDATHAKYTPKFVALSDVLFTSFAGKGGYGLQVKSDASGVEAAAPYDLVSLSGLQLVVAEDAGNSRVTLTSHPPAPAAYYWVTSPFTNATATPSAITEYPNNQRRQWIDLTNATQARICVCLRTTAFTAGTKFAFQYSADDTNWFYLDNSSGPFVSLSSLGVLKGSWVTLDAGAKADVEVRLVTVGGDAGTQAGQIGPLTLQLI